MAEASDKRTMGHLAAVHVVSDDEAAAGMYSVDDVVLPLPGSCISYPKHATAQVLHRCPDHVCKHMGATPGALQSAAQGMPLLRCFNPISFENLPRD